MTFTAALSKVERWRTDAACLRADPNIFFLAAGGRGGLEAKAVCAGCPVREPCLEFALEHQIFHGVWGGMTVDERRDVARERRRNNGKGEGNADGG